METRRILMTRGGGFIGTILANELRSLGHEVLAVNLYNTDHYVGRMSGILGRLNGFLRRFDYFYHLVAEYVIENLKMKL